MLVEMACCWKCLLLHMRNVGEFGLTQESRRARKRTKTTANFHTVAGYQELCSLEWLCEDSFEL